MVEMFVKQVGVNARDGHPVVLLRERDGERVLPIWVGHAEFKAIALAMSEATPDRPQTHDLMIDALEVLGARVVEVEICEISDGTFFAKLKLAVKDQEGVVLDCRPSDGIALALRHDAPITVAPGVVETAGYPDEEAKAEREAEEFKKFIDTLKPSDFAALVEKKHPEHSSASPPAAHDTAEHTPDSLEGTGTAEPTTDKAEGAEPTDQ